MSDTQILQPEDTKIAYFSMEMALDPEMPTYSGGLGVLAGDYLQSCADQHIPIIGVTCGWRKGYFRQEIREDGWQVEHSEIWNIDDFTQELPVKVIVPIRSRQVTVGAKQYKVLGQSGYILPIIFLSTDLAENKEKDRCITDYLYVSEREMRLAQEMVLGVGGVKILQALGYHNLRYFHLNEGHSALLVIELAKQQGFKTGDLPCEGVKNMCCFTTHTPVPSGHDMFSKEVVTKVMSGYLTSSEINHICPDDTLNMTHLALINSTYVNGVAQKHGQISRDMFPGYAINSITNGIHHTTWISAPFAALYDRFLEGWRNDPYLLRYAVSIPEQEISNAHNDAKRLLVEFLESQNLRIKPHFFTIGFARRMTAYKRPLLIFSDPEKLKDLSSSVGSIQVVMSGKAHPQDDKGRETIKKIIELGHELAPEVNIVFVPNYNKSIAKILVSGVDVWLNTPQKPLEASGTSGMKAAFNGVPSLSTLDGWWLEGCFEGVTGWSIGEEHFMQKGIPVADQEALTLYNKLGQIILPTFYGYPSLWLQIMRNTIAINGSFFHAHRMVHEYLENAYHL